MNARFDRIYETVSCVPAGCVASYGQVAEEAGLPRRARLVGTALHRLPDESWIPWQRVLRADGRLAFPLDDPRHQLQRSLLEAEGVEVNRGRVDLERFGWRGSRG